MQKDTINGYEQSILKPTFGQNTVNGIPQDPTDPRLTINQDGTIYVLDTKIYPQERPYTYLGTIQIGWKPIEQMEDSDRFMYEIFHYTTPDGCDNLAFNYKFQSNNDSLYTTYDLPKTKFTNNYHINSYFSDAFSTNKIIDNPLGRLSASMYDYTFRDLLIDITDLSIQNTPNNDYFGNLYIANVITGNGGVVFGVQNPWESSDKVQLIFNANLNASIEATLFNQTVNPILYMFTNFDIKINRR
jgi:hypothetical protein